MHLSTCKHTDKAAKWTFRRLAQFLFFFAPLLAVAQPEPVNPRWISGKVVDTQQEGIPQAVVVITSLDSLPRLLQSAITSLDGGFRLRLPTSRPCLITLSSMGYITKTDTLTPPLMATELPRVYMLPKAVKQLDEVQVRANKPLFELRPDRILVNVAGNPLFAGGNVTDILANTPRVEMKGTSIQVNQMNVVTVYQDGRLVLIDPGAAGVSKYLAGLPANLIQSIEVLTAPSAKYDAAGGAVILIKTQPSSSRGFSGNVAASFGASTYPRANSSLSFTWRSAKWSLNAFSFLNYQKRLSSYTGQQRLAMLPGAGQDGYTDTDTKQVETATTRNLRLTAIYTRSPRTSFGAVVFANPSQSIRQNTAQLGYRLPAPGSTDTNLMYTADNRDHYLDWSANVNLQHQLCEGCDEKHKRILTVDADYARFGLTNTTYNAYAVVSVSDQVAQQLVIQQPNRTKIITGKIDYQQATERGNWEGGLKGSQIEMQVRPVVDLATQSFETLAPNLSQPVDYAEQTVAGYFNRNVTVGRYTLQAGLRVEHTTQQTKALDRIVNERTYTQAFPNLQTSWSSAKNTQWTVSYARRILRPTIDILSPNFTFSDPFTLYRGNPSLAPEFTQVASIGAVTGKELSVQLNYTHGSMLISEVLIRSDPASAQLQNSFLNVNTSHQIGLTIGLPVVINAHWKAQITTTSFYNAIVTGIPEVPRQALFGGELQVVNTWTWNKWTGNLRFWGQSAIIDGFLHYRPLYTLSGGLQRAIWQDRGAIKLAFNDLLYSYVVRNYGQYLATDVSFVSRLDTRRVLLTLTYQFGNRKLTPLENREGSAADEQGRVRR